MKRLAYLLLIFALLIGISACGAAAPASLQSQTEAASSAPGEGISSAPAAEPAASPTDIAPVQTETGSAPETTEQPMPEPTAASVDWATIYTAFLKDNYTKLSELCFGGVAGVGFIDLDLDGVAELVLFDSGASASMGVQFFDIVDGEVQCISANMEDLGTEYGGDYYTDVFVNANLFEDFRLMHDGDGKPFFTVNSWNGALDFLYNETIVFGQAAQSESGAVLSLESVLFRYDEFDVDTGNTKSSRFESGGNTISEDEFNTSKSKMDSEWTDAGFEAKGALLWENQDYTQDYDGLMAMTADAITMYQAAVDFKR